MQFVEMHEVRKVKDLKSRLQFIVQSFLMAMKFNPLIPSGSKRFSTVFV